MAIFNSYVSLPEGIDYEWHVELDTLRCLQTLAGKSEKFL